MINNTIPSFFQLFDNNHIGLDDLNNYYDKHPEAFEEYFKFHCPKMEERLSNAIDKYPVKLEDILIISETLPSIIQEVIERYRAQFGFEVNVTFHLFVGGFGSNAFVESEIIGDIFFAAEKLSSEREHLRVIVAHEIGHIYHNVVLQENRMDWTKAEWTDPAVSLYREGVATYLSQQIVKGLRESVYYSYSSDGDVIHRYNVIKKTKSTLRNVFYKIMLKDGQMKKRKNGSVYQEGTILDTIASVIF